MRPAGPLDTNLTQAATVLIIEAPKALHMLSPQPGRQSVVMTRKNMLTADMIASIKPDAVIGPLITRDWDIVDLGIALQSQGYCGFLYALTPPLPRAELVIREVGALCQSLRVRLLETL
jgi:hypothetical protein